MHQISSISNDKCQQIYAVNRKLCKRVFMCVLRVPLSQLHTYFPANPIDKQKTQKNTKRKNALGWNRTSVLVAHLTVDSRTPLTGHRHPRRPPAMFRVPLWIDHVITTRLPGLVFGLMTVLRDLGLYSIRRARTTSLRRKLLDGEVLC